MRAYRLAWNTGLAAVLSLVLVTAFGAGVAAADAPGSLDPSFGVQGISLTSFGTGVTKAADMTIQPDGKYIVAGTYESWDATPTTPAMYATLARYNVDGSLDASFGTGGMAQAYLSAVSGAPDWAAAFNVALLPNSAGIVISVRTEPWKLQVMRFTANGQLDTSFGVNGLLEIGVAPWTVSPVVPKTLLTVQADGKMLVGCTLTTDRANDMAVFRLNPDGSADTTYGTGGLAKFDIAGGSDDRLLSMQLVAGGDLLLGGQVQSTEAVLLRLTPSGQLDSTFGTGGLVVEAGKRAVAGIALMPDGSYLTLDGSPNMQMGLRHYGADGTADTAFGIGGWANAIDPYNCYPFVLTHVVGQADGSILIAGTKDGGFPTYKDVWVSRFTAGGIQDTGFGVNGEAITDLGGADDCAAAAMGPDGKLVVAGYALPVAGRAAVVAGTPAARATAVARQGLVRYTLGASPLLRGPQTFAYSKATVKKGHGKPATFRFRVNALTSKATVVIKIFKGTKLKKTVALGSVLTNKSILCRWTVTVPKGKYVWKVYAVDQKHRKQISIGWNTLTVK